MFKKFILFGCILFTVGCAQGVSNSGGGDAAEDTQRAPDTSSPSDVSGMDSQAVDTQTGDADATPSDLVEVSDSGDDVTADTTMPDTSMPDTSMPDTSMPDTSMPDTSMVVEDVSDVVDTSGCAVTCAGGEECCDGACVDPLTSADHCGALCGVACGDGEVCSGGNCECSPDHSMCGDVCVPAATAVCNPTIQDTNTEPCGVCGGVRSQTRTCAGDCSWGAYGSWSACSITSCCGDGVCDGGETCGDCAADCGACGPVCGDGVCDSGETCAGCQADCSYGHLGDGSNGDPCPGVPAETWRCIYTASLVANVSQVCRNGAWVSFRTNPSDCSACVCSYSAACEQ